MAKNLVLSPMLGHLAQIWAAKIFFSKNLALSVTRYHGQLSSCTTSQKTNDPILRKLSDGRSDGQTDGRQWFHRALSDQRRASKNFLYKMYVRYPMGVLHSFCIKNVFYDEINLRLFYLPVTNCFQWKYIY